MENTAISESVPVEVDNDRERVQILVEKNLNSFVDADIALFGPANEPQNKLEKFVPAVSIDDKTTIEDIKPSLKVSLETGIGLSRAVIEAAKPQIRLESEKNLTMFERALAVLNGERQNSNSLVESVKLLTDLAIAFSEAQYSDRMDTLYEQESKKSSIWLGKLVLGREVFLGGVGGDEIRQFKEDFRKHALDIKEVVVRKFGQNQK